MFTDVAKLEINKQQRNALSVLLILAIAIFTALVHGVFRPARLMDLMKVLSVAAVYCIPVIGLVFGIAAAAGIRGEQRRMAEEMLPFSPRQRVLGAYIISLLLLTALSVFFVTACWWAGELMFLKAWPLVGPYWVLIPAVLYLHLLAFTLTYWTGQPLLGGGLALVCAALTGFCLFSLLSLYDRPFFDFSWQEFPLSLAKGAAIVALAAFAVLWILPPRIERHRAFRPDALVLGALLCLAPVLAFGALLRQAHDLETQLLPFQNWNLYGQAPVSEHLSSNAMLKTETGSIVQIGPDGARKLIHRADDLLLFQRPAIPERIVHTLTDSANRVWVLMIPDTRHDTIYELQKMEPGGTLKTYTTFQTLSVEPAVLVDSLNGIFVCGYSESINFCSPLPAPGKPLEWRIVGSKEAGFREATAELLNGALYEGGKVAILSKDNQTLTWKKSTDEIVRWNLPGKVEQFPSILPFHYVAPVYFVQGEPVFALSVQEANEEQRLVLSLPDGSIRDPWNRTWGQEPLSIRSVPGGTLWHAGPWNHRTDVIALSSEGDVFPALRIPDLYKQAGFPYPLTKTEAMILLPLRIADSLWMIVQNRFLQIDLRNSRIIHQTTVLPHSGWLDFWNSLDLQPTQQGIYFVSEGRIHLVAWDGKITDLGKATL